MRISVKTQLINQILCQSRFKYLYCTENINHWAMPSETFELYKSYQVFWQYFHGQKYVILTTLRCKMTVHHRSNMSSFNQIWQWFNTDFMPVGMLMELWHLLSKKFSFLWCQIFMGENLIPHLRSTLQYESYCVPIGAGF